MTQIEPAKKPSTHSDYAERILRVLSHVQSHLDEAIGPADLARVAGFSPHHFHRIFRGMVGESVMGHVRRLRLERAAWRLKFSEHPVTRLAFDAGYETHESFTRAFKERFGAAPRDFRAQHRRLDFPSAPTGVHYHPRGEIQGFDRPMTEHGSPDGAGRIGIDHWSAREVAYVRHVGPYNEVGQAWDKLSTWAAAQGLFGPGAAMLGLCYDDPEVTAAERIRYDACLEVTVGFEARGEIGRRQVPGGEYAVARHTGPYDQLASTYVELLGRWLPASGRAPEALPTVEVYWNDPDATPAEELETDLGILLKPQT